MRRLMIFENSKKNIPRIFLDFSGKALRCNTVPRKIMRAPEKHTSPKSLFSK
jgi:hypothetical protein